MGFWTTWPTATPARPPSGPPARAPAQPPSTGMTPSAARFSSGLRARRSSTAMLGHPRKDVRPVLRSRIRGYYGKEEEGRWDAELRSADFTADEEDRTKRERKERGEGITPLLFYSSLFLSDPRQSAYEVRVPSPFRLKRQWRPVPR